jgi:hypothetical protein
VNVSWSYVCTGPGRPTARCLSITRRRNCALALAGVAAGLSGRWFGETIGRPARPSGSAQDLPDRWVM